MDYKNIKKEDFYAAPDVFQPECKSELTNMRTSQFHSEENFAPQQLHEKLKTNAFGIVFFVSDTTKNNQSFGEGLVVCIFYARLKSPQITERLKLSAKLYVFHKFSENSNLTFWRNWTLNKLIWMAFSQEKHGSRKFCFCFQPTQPGQTLFERKSSNFSCSTSLTVEETTTSAEMKNRTRLIISARMRELGRWKITEEFLAKNS